MFKKIMAYMPFFNKKFVKNTLKPCSDKIIQIKHTNVLSNRIILNYLKTIISIHRNKYCPYPYLNLLRVKIILKFVLLTI